MNVFTLISVAQPGSSDMSRDEPDQAPVPHIVIGMDGSVRFRVSSEYLECVRPNGNEIFMPLFFEHDGAGAILWIDEEGPDKGLLENSIARMIFDLPEPIFGPVVCTGVGDSDGNVLPISPVIASMIRAKSNDFL